MIRICIFALVCQHSIVAMYKQSNPPSLTSYNEKTNTWTISGIDSDNHSHNLTIAACNYTEALYALESHIHTCPGCTKSTQLKLKLLLKCFRKKSKAQHFFKAHI